MELNGFN